MHSLLNGPASWAVRPTKFTAPHRIEQRRYLGKARSLVPRKSGTKRANMCLARRTLSPSPHPNSLRLHPKVSMTLRSVFRRQRGSRPCRLADSFPTGCHPLRGIKCKSFISRCLNIIPGMVPLRRVIQERHLLLLGKPVLTNEAGREGTAGSGTFLFTSPRHFSRGRR